MIDDWWLIETLPAYSTHNPKSSSKQSLETDCQLNKIHFILVIIQYSQHCIEGAANKMS